MNKNEKASRFKNLKIRSPPRIRGIGGKLRKLRNIGREKTGLLFNGVEPNF